MDRQRLLACIWTTILLAVVTAGTVSGEEVPPADATTLLETLTGMGDDTTAHKPQSKLWQHDDSWWSALSSGSGTWLWELSGTDWNPIFEIDDANDMHADCRRVGNLVHILLQDNGVARLVSLEFVGGSYQPWSARPSATTLTLGSSVETATLDMDSAGRLWVAYDTANEIQVRYSDSPYTSFSAPITLETGITTDDICVVTTLNEGSIGVLWSNQNAERFGFRRHVDGASATSWSSNEVPASQSAQSVGDGMADDHLNVAVSSNGTLYAAVKTSYDQPGFTKIGLLVRRPNGTWDDLHEVDTDGTRPIVILDEAAARIRVVYTLNEGSNPIVHNTASTSDFAFCEREVLINVVLLNATSTKETVTGDEVILASRNTTVRGVQITTEQDDPPPPTELGLVAHWAFEEGSGSQLLDTTGHGHTGTLSGAANWTTGVVGQALDLEGGYGIVNDHASLDLKTDLTIAVWVQPTEVRDQSILMKAVHDAVDGYELSLSASGFPFAHFNQDTFGNILFLEAAEPYPTNGDWMHLAITYDSDVMRLYVNGSLSSSKLAGSNIGLNSLPFTIAGAGDGANRFSGTMDEARVYDGALTAAEIQALADEVPPPPSSALVGHWRLDEGSGGLILDETPFQNHGTINGNATWVEGVDNLALEVDGFCTVPDHASLDLTTTITLAAWLRPEAVTTQYVMKKALAETEDGYELSLSSGGYPFVRFNQATSGNTFRINANSDYPSNGVDWIHVAATYDGNTMRLYVNGIEEGSLAAEFTINANSLALGLGSQEDGLRPFLGAMDDLRVYSRALSASEIFDLVTVPATAPSTGPDSSREKPLLVLAGPNPFRETIALRTEDSNAGLTVAIFDAIGRSVIRLNLVAGTNEAVWQAVDSNGRGVAAGVYWARLEFQGRALPHGTQRLILLR